MRPSKPRSHVLLKDRFNKWSKVEQLRNGTEADPDVFGGPAPIPGWVRGYIWTQVTYPVSLSVSEVLGFRASSTNRKTSRCSTSRFRIGFLLSSAEDLITV